MNSSFWQGKKVFLTGHTGFKGSWLSIVLNSLGAKAFGYALKPATSPSLFELAEVAKSMQASSFADIRDLNSLVAALKASEAEVVFHLAAQPLVRYSYEHPIETYETNVMGTLNLLEAVRQVSTVKVVVIVTTDKCYDNKEWCWGYRENEPMGGKDPYSSSKGCAELLTASYRDSFFPLDQYEKHGVAIATARAGNVIGGGDWSQDRLLPDIVDSIQKQKPLTLRYPQATRPWQHVLESLSGYLLLAEKLFGSPLGFSGAWNFGPESSDACSVASIVEKLYANFQLPSAWQQAEGEQPHEAHYLHLDISKAKQQLAWRPRWNIDTAIEKIAEWYQGYQSGQDVLEMTVSQINDYFSGRS